MGTLYLIVLIFDMRCPTILMGLCGNAVLVARAFYFYVLIALTVIF